MAMLERSLRARVIARGARNYRSLRRPRRRLRGAGLVESTAPRNRVMRMPSGPAAVITPWNAPFMLSTWKTAPALAAGCTVVLKPAEWSPLSCSLLADLAAEAGLPAGRLQRRPGHRRGGGRRARRPPRRAPGQLHRLARDRASDRPALPPPTSCPFTAELGGKGPLIVFADADLEAAARKAAGQYDDAGQVCLAGTPAARRGVGPRRVPRALPPPHRRPRARRPARRRDHRLAADPPRPPGPRRGLRRAGAGARRHDRARRPPRPSSGGLCYEPTLIEPAANDSEIVQREVFGPVLTFQTFADEAEAVAARQLHAVRAVGHRLHRRARARRAGRPGGARRHRLGRTPSSSAT